MCVCAVLTGCAFAAALSIWQARGQCRPGAVKRLQAREQCRPGALERVRLPFGMHVSSADRVHLSEFAYHLAGVCAAISGRTCAGVPFARACADTIRQACAQCSLERVCFLGKVCVCVRSADWVHLCRQSLPFGRRVRSAELASVPGCAYLFGRPVCSADRVHLSGCT